jgi:phosphomannomutase
MQPRALDPSILREYDIRGIYGATLTAADFHALGCAFASRVLDDGGQRIAVGRDGRLSSEEAMAALVDGMLSTGVTVQRIGLGPSPMLYFAVHHLQADAGLMVTGSHNPADYNGLKMVAGGRSMFGPAIQDLGRDVAEGRFRQGAGSVTDVDVRGAYLDRLLADLRPMGRPLNIAWDPGHGACAVLLPDLCRRLPGAHFLINSTVDGSFPAHHPDPTVEANLEELRAVVAERGCDLGIAFDGDGDRIGVIDSLGRTLFGDQLLVLFAAEVLKAHPGATVITDVKSSQVLFDEITRLGGTPVMGRTGHSLIKTLMAETGALLAGEVSGHIFFADHYYGFDDGLYAAIRLIDLLAQGKRSLAELRYGLPTVVTTPEIRIACSDDRKFGVVEAVRDRLRSAAAPGVVEIDGVRVPSADGWWLLRASNTQPALVVRCEAATPEGLAVLKSEIACHLAASGIDGSALSA